MISRNLWVIDLEGKIKTKQRQLHRVIQIFFKVIHILKRKKNRLIGQVY